MSSFVRIGSTILRHARYLNQRSSRCTYYTSSPLSKPDLSVAIVGSGPSGCYTAKYLILTLEQLQQKGQLTNANMDDLKNVNIDILEKLPTPFGLVRSGVAPDHPEVKNVENDFSLLFQDNHENQKQSATVTQTHTKSKTEKLIQKSIVFRGNVAVGKDISLQELQSLYDVVVLAYGCESNRKLGLEGESLDGVFSAREFVAWYNGHPEFAHMGSYFKQALGNNPSQANVVVIGQGNVALDCARILAKGSQGLMSTDIASHALEIIQDGVEKTTVLGRRGHVQGAFTIKELRELTKLQDASFIVDEAELDAGTTAASLEELNGPGSRPKIRIDKLLRKAAAKTSPEEEKSKQVRLRFLLNPVQFIPDSAVKSRLGSVLCERTRLEGELGNQVAVGTGEMEEITANMALVSIGYKGLQLPGMNDALFDEKTGVVRNTNGKVHSKSNLYASGWLKRGPSGIIGTNISDAKDTVSSIVNDLRDIAESKVDGRVGLDSLLSERNIQVIDWESYQRIDAAEKDTSRLRSDGQPREKFTNVDEMLNYK